MRAQPLVQVTIIISAFPKNSRHEDVMAEYARKLLRETATYCRARVESSVDSNAEVRTKYANLQEPGE